MKTYRVYCDGREFGIDYPTLEVAQAIRRAWAAAWPAHRYYIRPTGRSVRP